MSNEEICRLEDYQAMAVVIEEVLSPDEAFTLFDIAQGALIAMGEKLPVRKEIEV